MGAGRDGVGGLEQLKLAGDEAADQIELGDLGGVPEGDEGAFVVPGDGDGDGVGGRNGVALGEVETFFHGTGGNVEEHGEVRQVVGDEKFFAAPERKIGDGGGVRISHSLACSGADVGVAAGGELLHRHADHAIGSHFAVRERIDNDAAAGIAFAVVAGGIGDGGHA